MPRAGWTLVTGGALAVCALLAIPAEAGVVDWNNGHRLQGVGGEINPAVLVAFNPQPEPPDPGVDSLLNLFYPPDPIRLTVPDVHNPDAGDPLLFDLYFAIGIPGGPLSVVAPDAPDAPFSTLSLDVNDAAGFKVFEVIFGFETSSGGLAVGGDEFFFNPQREPPAGLFDPDGDFGMSFSFSSLSDATVTLTILVLQGNQVMLVRAPEPGFLPLMAGGLLALGAARRRHRG